MPRLAILGVAALAGLTLASSAAGRGTAFVQFHTPSGNIHCGYGSFPGETPFLRCDIFSRFRPLPPRPASCDFDWGIGVSMGRTGRAALICISDTVADPNGRVLGYGQTWRRGGFSCVSRSTGLTCTNLSRHGFFLSRERSRLF
jgi:hypothetical protein